MEQKIQQLQQQLISNLEASHASELKRREFERLAELEGSKFNVFKEEIQHLYAELRKMNDEQKNPSSPKQLSLIEDNA